jgi:hypothetical protein
MTTARKRTFRIGKGTSAPEHGIGKVCSVLSEVA